MYFIISTIFVIGFIVTVLGLGFAIGYILSLINKVKYRLDRWDRSFNNSRRKNRRK